MKEFKHGLNGYTNYKCRCDICKTAMRDYKRARRYRKYVKEDFEDSQHRKLDRNHTYRVLVTEIYEKEVILEAGSEEDAIELTKLMHLNDYFMFEHTDLVLTDYEVINSTEDTDKE